MNFSPPSLSVIMCNYNHAKYLEQSVSAILSQDDYFLELIFVDDGSVDDSLEVLDKIIKKYSSSKVKILKNRTNEGVIYSANLALESAQGDYIYWGAADDNVLPGFFEKTMGVLKRYPEAGLCCSDPIVYEENAKKYRTVKLPISDSPIFLYPSDWSNILKKKNLFLAGHTTIFKKSCLFDVGGWVKNLQWYTDWFALHSIIFRYGACYLPEGLACLRIADHTYSSSGIKKGQKQVLQSMLEILGSSQFLDIQSHFKKSGILFAYGKTMLSLVLGDNKYRDYLNTVFIKKISWYFMKGFLKKQLLWLKKFKK